MTKQRCGRQAAFQERDNSRVRPERLDEFGRETGNPIWSRITRAGTPEGRA
jgi:hypothetical protein